MFQNDLWKTKRLLSQNKTNLHKWEIKTREEREARLQRIADLEAHLAYLEAAELDEVSL